MKPVRIPVTISIESPFTPEALPRFKAAMLEEVRNGLAANTTPEQQKRRGRPRLAASTSMFSCRIPTDVYDRACRKAMQRGLTLSDVVRAALNLYV